MITVCIFAEDNDPILDDFTLKRWGSTLMGIKKHKKQKVFFWTQKVSRKHLHFLLCPRLLPLSPLQHCLKRRGLVGFFQGAICYKGQFARQESVVCVWLRGWLDHAWAEPLRDSQGYLLGHPSSCVWQVGTLSLCCKEMAGSEGRAGVDSWPYLKGKPMSVYG